VTGVCQAGMEGKKKGFQKKNKSKKCSGAHFRAGGRKEHGDRPPLSEIHLQGVGRKGRFFGTPGSVITLWKERKEPGV